MYKLQKNEGLYRVSDNKYIVATHVEVMGNKVRTEHRANFRGREIVTVRTYPLGEIGIFLKEDVKDRCSRPLWMDMDIYFFHNDLYDYGFLHDDVEDFATFTEDEIAECLCIR